MLRVSSTTLQNWERRGLLHPRKRIGGKITRWVIVYDPQELVKLPAYRRQHEATKGSPFTPGEVTARAFEMFDDGKSIREVVIDLRETVSNVEGLHEQWLDLGGRECVIAGDAKAKLEEVLGAFATVDELVERVLALRPMEVTEP